MNPAEQKSHKNVTDTLRADFKQLSEDHDALDARDAQSTADLTRILEGQAKHHAEGLSNAVRAITDLRTGHDDRIGEISLDHRAFTTRGFWSRLNWLITGR